MSAVFQAYLAGTEKGKSRLDELTQRLFRDDPKTFLAYAFGKPPESLTLQGPEGENLIPQSVILAAVEAAKRL